jgi:hypothetical protein
MRLVNDTYIVHNSSKKIINFHKSIQDPPNFLISSEISRHTTPIVVLPPEPTPIDANLVQFGTEENGSSSPDLLAERLVLYFS